MPIHLENLDSITRNYMLSEVNMDFEKDSIYYSKYLKSGLEDSWNNIFIKAVIEHNDVWLEQQTEIQELLVKTYQKRNPTGGFTTAKVPYTAPQTLAEGEFNRFYPTFRT